MSDITVQILEDIRRDIAAMDAKFEAKFDAVDAKFLATQQQIEGLGRNLGRRLDRTDERLNSIVALMGHFARRDDDIDARLRALEAEVFRRSPT
jgi:ABC-type transporter Mla subunit MlaD